MYNSIERQIVCVDRLIQYMKQVPVESETIQYQVITAINHLKELGLPCDLADKYLDKHWKYIRERHIELEERIKERDIPYLMDLLEYLDGIRKL